LRAVHNPSTVGGARPVPAGTHLPRLGPTVRAQPLGRYGTGSVNPLAL